jgi:hypothetical protein
VLAGDKVSVMEKPTSHGVYEIRAQWDSEAGVWVARARMSRALLLRPTRLMFWFRKLRTLILELLELNGVPNMKSGTARSRNGVFLWTGKSCPATPPTQC